MYGLTRLATLVGSEKRPLSWLVGPGEVYRPELPSTRDERRPGREDETSLMPPDQAKADGEG
jgi:NADH-quinone oxidoreductase subunit B